MDISQSPGLRRAKAVLKRNDRGDHTVPQGNLYPFQWLWDSCFTAIGLAHYDTKRAMREIDSLLAGQWENGMIPHIIFTHDAPYWVGPGFWRTTKLGLGPKGITTSAITQPPLLSVAALAIADKLESDQANQWLRRIYPKLLAYHQWIYSERDPNKTGLAVLLHSWESGLDNSPPWMELLKRSVSSD